MQTCVPTGIKTGVSTTPCRNVITPTLAFVVPHFAITLYISGGFSCAGKSPLFGMFNETFVDIVCSNARARFDIRSNLNKINISSVLFLIELMKLLKNSPLKRKEEKGTFQYMNNQILVFFFKRYADDIACVFRSSKTGFDVNTTQCASLTERVKVRLYMESVDLNASNFIQFQFIASIRLDFQREKCLSKTEATE